MRKEKMGATTQAYELRDDSAHGTPYTGSGRSGRGGTLFSGMPVSMTSAAKYEHGQVGVYQYVPVPWWIRANNGHCRRCRRAEYVPEGAVHVTQMGRHGMHHDVSGRLVRSRGTSGGCEEETRELWGSAYASSPIYTRTSARGGGRRTGCQFQAKETVFVLTTTIRSL